MDWTFRLINLLLLIAIIALLTLIINLGVATIATMRTIRLRKSQQAKAEDYTLPAPRGWDKIDAYTPDTIPEYPPLDSYGRMCRGSGRLQKTGTANGIPAVWCGQCHRHWTEEDFNPACTTTDKAFTAVPVHDR